MEGLGDDVINLGYWLLEHDKVLSGSCKAFFVFIFWLLVSIVLLMMQLLILSNFHSSLFEDNNKRNENQDYLKILTDSQSSVEASKNFYLQL